jgi:hypothetical protein
MTSQETKQVGMAVALSCREARFQDGENWDGFIGLPYFACGCPGERLYKVRVPRWFPISSRQSREHEQYGAECPRGKEETAPANRSLTDHDSSKMAQAPQLTGSGSIEDTMGPNS